MAAAQLTAAALVDDVNGLPIDMFLDGNILYVLFTCIGEIYAYRVAADGMLTQEPTSIGGLGSSESVPFHGLGGGMISTGSDERLRFS